MQDHQHTIDEVFTLQEHLDSKAATNHKHAEYAEVNHKHGEYATADHTHGNYAAATHKHSDYANKSHSHKCYAPAEHTHDDLQEHLDSKAATNHKHAEYAEVNHKHGEYATTEHTHGNYAAATHKHSEYANKSHSHKCYAPAEHTHEDLQAAIEAVSKKIGCSCALVLQEGASIQIDGFHEGKPQQIICTNTDKVVHIKDYFVSSLPKRFNCQNIIIAPGKTFAARVLRTATVSYILFDGILNEL